MGHDLIGWDIADNIVEDKSGWDDFPDILTEVCFIFYHWFRNFAPMSDFVLDLFLSILSRDRGQNP